MVASNTSAPAAAASRARPAWAARRQRIGAAYAAPAAVIVGVFFLIPLVLVRGMSLDDWPLIGEATLKLPADCTGISDNPMFVAGGVFRFM